MTIRERIEAMRARRWLRGCARVGDAPRLYGRPEVDSYDGTIIIGNRVSLISWPVRTHVVAGPGAELEIADDVSIGHGGAVAAFERVQIGAGTHIGPFVIIMDTNFHGRSGDQSVQHDCRPVIIGRNCRIGSRVTITRGSTIGDGAEILAGSVVSSSIPAGACAGGARARVIGVAGELASRWDSAAALLPLVIADALQLSAPLEGGDTIPNVVDQESRPRVLSAIDAQFGVSLPASAIARDTRISDLVAVVDSALRTQLGSERV